MPSNEIKPGSFARRQVRGAAASTASPVRMVRTSVVLSSLAGAITALAFLNQLLTAKMFGAQRQFDLYLVAVSVPLMIAGTASAALSQAFVPKLRSLYREPEKYRKAVATMLLFTFTAASLLAIGSYFLTMATASLAAIGSVRAEWAYIDSIAKPASLSAGLAVVASGLSAVHHSEMRFAQPALVTVAPYIGMICAMIFGPPQAGPLVLAWGMMAGTGVAVLVLAPSAIIHARGAWSAPVCWPLLTDDAGRLGLVLLGNLAFTGLAPVEALVAPGFGAGALSFLGYSQRLVIAISSLVIAGPSALLVPSIAEARANGDRAREIVIASTSIGLVVAFASVVAALLFLLRVPVIQLCFERGAFDATMTRGVADTLPWLLVGSVAMLGSVAAVRVLNGQSRHFVPAAAGIAMPVAYFGLATGLSRAFGYQGICAAYALSWWIVFLFLLHRLFLWHPWASAKRLAKPVGALGGALAVAAASVWAGREVLFAPGARLGTAALAWRCGVLGVGGLLLFLIAATVFCPVPEIQMRLQRFCGIRGKV